MKLRVFLAFELPKPIKEIVAKVSGELTQATLEIKWVRVDHIHLTVLFLGNIEEQMAGPIDQVAGAICARYAPFEIALKSMGCFPNIKRARVLWLGMAGDLIGMTHFQKELQKELKILPIKEEDRNFKPHLTLGRFRNPGANQGRSLDQILEQYRDLTSPAAALTELVLFKSILKPEGAEYTKLNAWPLSGPLKN